ncbi:protein DETOXIFICATION 14-like [Pistacia vera]|uniref:protein DETOXIFICATION 14-like n=1 Tax=Pistacia vera TaxID=55513 RepID=UPI0012632234|nr:protein DETOXIFICATION 14-like [Pistacia vera]
MGEEKLPKREDKIWKVVTRAAFLEELKKLSFLAAPMVAVTVSQYLMQVVSMIMVGHLGQLSISSLSIATSFTNVTGFSPLFGLACALETLCGQAYGAKQYHKLGTYTYSSIIILIPICFPISVIWIFMDKILVLVGQDPQVSVEACKYSICLIPALLGFAVLRSLIHYLQSQSLILPMFLSSCATLCAHIPLCWTLVYKVDLGNRGAALSLCLSYWLNVIILGLYIRYSSSCEKTRTFILSDIFSSIKEFLRFALPSVVMICLEWWSFEIVILLSGLLPNSKLETSVLSICLITTSLHYVIPCGFGAAASTRVSNELGAGNPGAARLAVYVVMILAVSEAVIVSITLFFCRYVLGYAYTNDKEVVDYVIELAPLLCLSVIMDSMQAVLSEVARGSGWQRIGAYVNLGAYYLVGIPVAAVLCFALHLRGKGLWIGIVTGSAVQAMLLALVTSFTNWQKQVPIPLQPFVPEVFASFNPSCPIFLLAMWDCFCKKIKFYHVILPYPGNQIEFHSILLTKETMLADFNFHVDIPQAIMARERIFLF